MPEPILILAAGSSSRMRGRDKLLELIDGVPLLRRTALRALKTGHPVFIALPARPHARYDTVEDLQATLIEVPDAAEGINATLRRGVAVAHEAEALMILLADLPNITTQDMQAVFAARQEHPAASVWRGATETGQPGHPTLIDRAHFAQILELSGDVGAQPVIKAAKNVHLVPLGADAACMDLDTPEDWKAWRILRSDI